MDLLTKGLFGLLMVLDYLFLDYLIFGNRSHWKYYIYNLRGLL